VKEDAGCALVVRIKRKEKIRENFRNPSRVSDFLGLIRCALRAVSREIAEKEGSGGCALRAERKRKSGERKSLTTKTERH